MKERTTDKARYKKNGNTKRETVFIKVHIFWGGHKILQNLHCRFVLCSASQIYSGDFAKFSGLLRIYDFQINSGIWLACLKLGWIGTFPEIPIFTWNIMFSNKRRCHLSILGHLNLFVCQNSRNVRFYSFTLWKLERLATKIWIL